MNTKQTLSFLTVPEEQIELEAAIEGLGLLIATQESSKPLYIKLKRTFNQKGLDGDIIKFWRVMFPSTHANYGSDLSISGLKEWGIIK